MVIYIQQNSAVFKKKEINSIKYCIMNDFKGIKLNMEKTDNVLFHLHEFLSHDHKDSINYNHSFQELKGEENEEFGNYRVSVLCHDRIIKLGASGDCTTMHKYSITLNYMILNG